MAERKIIWAVCGGAASEGKTVVAANLASAMAATGFSVLLVDADPASASGTTPCAASVLGMDAASRPLIDGASSDWSASDIAGLVTETGTEGIALISGAGCIFGGATWSQGAGAPGPVASGFTYALLEYFSQSDFGCMVADLGASATPAALDLAGLSNEIVLVLGPSPASVKASFEFLKKFVYRRVEKLFAENPLVSIVIDEATDPARAHPVRTFADLVGRIAEVNEHAASRAVAEVKSFVPALVLSKVAEEKDLAAATVLSDAASAYLGLTTVFAGPLRQSDRVAGSVVDGVPFATLPAPDGGEDGPAAEINSIIEKLFGSIPRAPELADEPSREQAEAGVDACVFEVFGFNDNVTFNGTVFHVQTEVGGGPDPYIETVVYQGGRVFLSKRSLWSKVGDPSGLAADIRGFAERQHAAAMAAVRENRIMYGEEA